jgi:hypothetical protein
MVGKIVEIFLLNIANGLVQKPDFTDVRRQELPKNSGLHSFNILRRVVKLGRNFQGTRLPLIAALNGPQAEKKQPADNQENRTKHSEYEQHLFVDRQMFKPFNGGDMSYGHEILPT